MVWSVNARQIQLAELLTRRQFPVTSEAGTAGRVADAGGAKSVTAVPEVTPPALPFTLRLFLRGWGSSSRC